MAKATTGSGGSVPEVHLLGEIVVAFGNLELFLETSIWHFLASAKDRERFLMAQAITAKMPFAQKVHALGSMFQLKNIASAESELSALVKELFDAEAERNQLLHSAWNYSREGFFMRMKASAQAKKGLTRGFHRMPAARIKLTLDKIEAASQTLAKFTVKYIQPSEHEIGEQ